METMKYYTLRFEVEITRNAYSFHPEVRHYEISVESPFAFEGDVRPFFSTIKYMLDVRRINHRNGIDISGVKFIGSAESNN